jgi:trehalose-6-phosphate hydrolase
MSQRQLISNYPDGPLRKRLVTLRPYESFVLHLIDP